MEAQIGGGTHRFYGPDASQFNGFRKRSLEWDLNDWKWDGNLFVATPLHINPSDCRNKQLFPTPVIEISNDSSTCSDETDLRINGKGKGAMDKRRREVTVMDENELNDKSGSLALKLGVHDYPNIEADLASLDGKNGKRSKVQGGNSNRPVCQVEGCVSNLGDAKDYHRRHKVCEMHAKASRALVGNVMQRFCQQCSRFHLLQEFDEGKRSCRRRLAGHNRRRRKSHPDAVTNGNSVTDDRASSYLLISLLRILSNLQSNTPDQPKSQDLLVHLLRSLANLAGSFDASNLPGLLQATQDLRQNGSSDGTSSEPHALTSNGITSKESSRPLFSASKMICITETQDPPVRSTDQSMSVALGGVEMPQKRNIAGMPLGDNLKGVPSQISTSIVPIQDGIRAKAQGLCSVQRILPIESTVERVRLRSFDLNDTYDDRQDTIEGSGKPVPPKNLQLGSLTRPVWTLQDCWQTSPPQTSGNSDSASAQSLSSSSGDAQSRTDRMVFKLFGKDPSDFPHVLRDQILGWLSNSPTDIEGYIRPGCIILTLYLRLPKSTWEELCCNLSASLRRLLDVADDDFWRTGWVYARVQHQIAFVYNGQVVLDTSLPLDGHNHCKISTVTPIAVSFSRKVIFTIKGSNLVQPTARLLCAFEGRYLTQETTQALVDGTGVATDPDGSQCLHFSCSLPNATGRGFIEIEDHGFSGGFFPFIVAEEDVSSEICMLESSINVASSHNNGGDTTTKMKARDRALDFLHEMGWLLRRSYLSSSSENLNSCSNVFPIMRFKSLMEFSMDHNWCAVVKKLLDILFGGAVDVGEHTVELALSEMALLHSAVQKSCRPMVELLLRYVPRGALENTGSLNTKVGSCPGSYIFRPDMLGPFDVTPLHIAASRDGSESVLDALTDDPGLVGIRAWKGACDSTGFTPEDYAKSRGYESYIHLVQKKLNQKSGAGHVTVDIPGISQDLDVIQNQADRSCSSRTTGLQIDKRGAMPMMQPSCRLCARQVAYGVGSRTLKYRPTMLFMVGIATVCVCVGLLLKSPPQIFCVFSPFRWESLEYGAI